MSRLFGENAHTNRVKQPAKQRIFNINISKTKNIERNDDEQYTEKIGKKKLERGKMERNILKLRYNIKIKN